MACSRELSVFFTERKHGAVFPKVRAPSSPQAGERKFSFSCAFLCAALHRWPHCSCFCVFKNETSPRDYQILIEFISNWNNKNTVYFFFLRNLGPCKKYLVFFSDPNFYFFIQNIRLTRMFPWKAIRGWNKICAEKVCLTFLSLEMNGMIFSMQSALISLLPLIVCCFLSLHLRSFLKHTFPKVSQSSFQKP